MARFSRFAFGILIVFWVIFFRRQIAGGEVWYCCDNLLINVPAKVYFAHEIQQGRFPLHNPYIFSGAPFFADINLSLLHPFNLLYLVLPPFRALTVSILALFLVGSMGMYVFGRTLRMSRFASVAGAIVFGLCGSLVVYANNVSILQVAVLVPWVLAMWVRYIRISSQKRLAAFVSVAAFQIFSGHPQITYYTWLMLIAYSFRTDAWKLVKAGFLVMLGSSVQLVPFAFLALSSTRAGGDFAYATIDSVHPISLIRLILPGIVGNLARGTAWIQAGSIHGYVGFLPLLLLPLAWSHAKGKFFVAVAVAALLMAMGKYTPVFYLAYHLIPGIAWFREPSQFLFIWSFALAVCAMIACDSLASVKTIRRSVQTGAFALLPARLQEKIYAFSIDEVVYNINLISVFTLIASFSLQRLRESTIAKLVFLAVLFADLSVYGQTNLTTIPEFIVSGWYRNTKEKIGSWGLSSRYRYYTDPEVYAYPDKKPLGQYNDPGESMWQFAILRPNIGMLYGLPAVDGYASMVSLAYQRQFGGTAGDPTGLTVSSIIDPHLASSGVLYLITKPKNPLLDDTSRYHLLDDDGKVAMYEDREAVPITFSKENAR